MASLYEGLRQKVWTTGPIYTKLDMKVMPFKDTPNLTS
jgi:hypothetical protein